MAEGSEIRLADDTFLVIARFGIDDIPLQVCTNLADAEALAVVVANDPEIILRDMEQTWQAMLNVEPDLTYFANVIILRLLGGAIPVEMVGLEYRQED